MEKTQRHLVREAREPGKVDNHLPVQRREAGWERRVAADQNCKTCDQLNIGHAHDTLHEGVLAIVS